jgi:hypothetical protein
MPAIMQANPFNRCPMMGLDTGTDWDKVSRLAAIGMNPAEVENIGKLCSFVQRWSGGKDATILDDLESYEKTLLLRRNILAADLQLLAECDITEYDRIIPVSLYTSSQNQDYSYFKWFPMWLAGCANHPKIITFCELMSDTFLLL